MNDCITVSPDQYFVHLNYCVIRKLGTSMAFDTPPKRSAHSGKTLAGKCWTAETVIQTNCKKEGMEGTIERTIVSIEHPLQRVRP